MTYIFYVINYNYFSNLFIFIYYFIYYFKIVFVSISKSNSTVVK